MVSVTVTVTVYGDPASALESIVPLMVPVVVLKVSPVGSPETFQFKVWAGRSASVRSGSHGSPSRPRHG